MRNKKSRDIIFRLLRSSHEEAEQLRKKTRLNQKEFDMTANALMDDMILKFEGSEIYIVEPDLVKNAIKKVKTSFLNELAESLIDFLDSE